MILSHEMPEALPKVCAPRDELMEVFDRCMVRPYVYLQAPAGYGKTVATLLWLKKTQRAFAWLAIGLYDNNPSLFYRMFCRTLLTALPQNETLNQFVASPSFSASPVESTMEFLLMFSWRGEQRDERPDEPFVLVLDDLHQITNVEILKSLPYVLAKLPPTVKVFLLSRTTLPDPMASLKENNKTTFISSGELAFTVEEIHKFFADYGKKITEEEANKIHSETDGWIILLNTMVISDCFDLSSETHSLTLEEFFEKNIWNSFDAETQSFLMKTSIVDSFTPELCEVLTGSSNCAEMLDSLIKGNISLSFLGGEYRYHHLFLEFLRNRLMESEIEQKHLREAVATYYLEKGEHYKAAEHALESGNPQLDMQVIQGFFSSRLPTLEQYREIAQIYDINKLTDEFCKTRPILYMPNILSALLAGDIKNTSRFFDLFYAALPAFSEIEHPVADVAITRLILDYRVRLGDLPSFLDSLQLTTGKAVSGQAAVATMQMPFLHRSNRDYTEFLDPETKKAVHGLFSALLPNDVECFYQSVEAGLLMEQNRLDEAIRAATDAYELLREDTAAEVRFGVSVGLAHLCLLKSDREQAKQILGHLRRWIEQNKAHYLLKNLSAYEQRLKLWDGDRIAARIWLNNYFVGSNSFGEFYKMFQHFTTVRALIVLSMPKAAFAALAQLKALSQGMNRLLDLAECEVLTAVIEWGLGAKLEARERLLALLCILQPHGYIRVIADEGKAVLPILSAILRKTDTETPEGISRYRYVKEIQVAAYQQSKSFRGIMHDAQSKPIKFSPRQRYILELLAKGYKNAEIVKLSGLSINTIRSHTKIIYLKLEVTSALDAITKAKRLGLI